MEYTDQQPQEPGWYWCTNKSGSWEAIVHIENTGTITGKGIDLKGLTATWINASGNVGFLHEKDWSNKYRWAGPIPAPSRS